MNLIVVDCLTGESGKRNFSRDFIGSGPRYIAGYIEKVSNKKIGTKIIRGEEFLNRQDSFIQNYPIIAISAMTMDKIIVQNVYEKWKKVFPNESKRFSVIGGPIINESGIVKKFDFDCGIRNESEIALKVLFGENIGFFLNIKKSNNKKSKEDLFFEIKNHSLLCFEEDNVICNIPAANQEVLKIFSNSAKVISFSSTKPDSI